MASDNPYLSLMEGVVAGDDARFQASTSQALGVNADQAAAAKRVAGYLGVPTEVVEAAPEDAERQAKTRKLDEDTADAPVLRQRYTRADFAKLAHDDSGVLSAVEKAAKWLTTGGRYKNDVKQAASETGKFVAESAKQLALGATVGLGAAEFDLAALPLDVISGLTRWALPQDVAGGLAADYRARAQAARRAMAEVSTPMDGNIGKGWMSGMQSSGQNLALLPAGVASGSGKVLATIMGTITGARAYTEAREKGLNQGAAATYAVPQGVFEYAFEKVPASRLVSDLTRNVPFLQMAARQLVPEITGEQATTVLQDLNEWVRLNPEKPLRQFIEERPDAAVQTLVATLVGVGVQTGTVSALQRTLGQSAQQEARAADAEAYAEWMGDLLKTAAGSKLRERDPAGFAEFAQEAAQQEGHDGNVHVDGAVLAQALEQAKIPLEEFAQMSPAAAGDLQAAMQTGGTVAIPMGDLLGKFGDSGLEQALLPHLRATEDSLSQEEAKLVTQQAQQLLQRDSERLLQQAADSEVAAASAQTVRQTVLDQLTTTNRFTKDVNEAYASLASSFYAATAARFGVTAEEVYQRYPLRVQGETPAGARVDQANPLVAEQVRAWAQEVAQRHGLEKFDVQPTGRALKVGLMTVPEGERAQGKGSAVMQELIDYADKFGFRVELSPAQPSDGFGTTSRQRLVDFYKRFGFVENKGRAKDYEISEAMYREPQSLAQGKRGSFSPSKLTISLLEKADLSTFLHETGHFYLEALADMAAQPDAPADIATDMQTVLEWFGVRTLEEWRGMSLDEQRPYHEKFAESFEQYLFEGKAPSRELAGLFGRFRAWLANVYESLQSFMASYNTGLSDEVRGVFDRLIATQEQIQQAEEDHGFSAMLAALEGKVDPALLERYKAAASEASEEAMAKMQSRSLRDLRWVINARGRALRKLSADVADKREAMEKEVTAEVDGSPEMQARVHLEEVMRTTPDVKDARKGWRDRRAAALERAREDVKKVYSAQATEQGLKGLEKGQYLAKHRKVMEHEVNGLMLQWERENPFPVRAPIDDINLDAIAEQFGFTSGDHMLKAIDDFGDRKVAIEGITNQRMLERYGDLVTPEGLQRAADEAVHNEARARAVATELQALADAGVSTQPTGKTITANTKNGRVQYQQRTNVLVKAAKQFAAQLVDGRKVKDLKPVQHTAAERRAGKRALEATMAGKTEEAIQAKRDQLLNFYAAKETIEAQHDVERGVKYLLKVADSETLDPAYRDQIAVLLERFDLRRATEKELQRRASLLEWVETQREMGVETNIPPELLDEAQRTNYRNMTVGEFRALVDTVKQIEHLGRLKHKLLTAKDEREFGEIVQRIASGITDNARGRKADTRTPNTALGEARVGLQKFWASHIKAATWARIMDGGQDGGPVWEYLIRNANEAGNREIRMREQATRELAELVAPLLKSGKMGGKGVYIPAVNRSFNREARLAIALNTGNESNLQRLAGGEGWNADQIKAITDTLTAEEWRFVQKVWDYFESYRPEIAAKEKRVTGVEPKWIEASPREQETADGKVVKLRGGYYPVKYDPRASERAESHADAEMRKQEMRGAYTSATTRRSFTKNRAEEVNGRPLLYSLDGVYNGVTEVIHDLAWHEFLIDANRLVRNQSVAGAMRDTYGPDAHQQFKKWLLDVATGDRPAQAAGEQALSWIRQGVSISGLGFNIMTALIQPLGITQSIVRVGTPWIGRGVAQFVADPIGTVDEVNQKSDFMRTRAMTRFRELAEVRTQVRGASKARQAIDGGAYFLMLRAQQLVDVPTWVGAYEKAIANGNDEQRAIDLADQAVIDAQGSGTAKDQSAIERGGPALKLFTTFYAFFNTAFNMGVAQGMTRENKAKLAADYLLLYVAPVVLGALLKDAITPGDSGDDDPAKLAKKLAGEQLSYLFGLMFGLREVAGAAQVLTGTNQYGSDYSGPAGLRPVADTYKLAKQVNQGEADDALRKAIINTAGELLRLPAAQINRSITGAKALADGETSNPAAVLFGYQKVKD